MFSVPASFRARLVRGAAIAALCAASLCNLPAAAQTLAPPARLVDAFFSLRTELRGSAPDYGLAIARYDEILSPLVRQRDGEANPPTVHDEEIRNALAAGESGALSQAIVAQLFDKLMQKAFFQSIRSELRTAADQINQPSAAQPALERAKAYYEALRGTVERREAAYGIPLLHHADGAFEGMAVALRHGDELGFHLARQILDKTLMKTVYLAVGARPHGYAYRIEAAVREGDLVAARTMQAEAWAFYQSIYSYLRGSAPADADYIQAMLDLRTDVGRIDAERLNEHFIAAIAAVASHEYDESFESWGAMRAAITSLEGALFVSMLEPDLRAILGDDGYAALEAAAQEALDAVHSDERATAEAAVRRIEATLFELTH